MATVSPVDDKKNNNNGSVKTGRGYLSAPEFEKKWRDDLSQKMMNESMNNTKRFIKSMSGDDEDITAYT